MERCELCEHCVPCKNLINGEWVWFKICKLFADEKGGWCIVVDDTDMCECFQENEVVLNEID